MVDQSYIEEIKRRNAARAAKLKDSLKIGDFSKLAPSGTDDEPPGAVIVTPGGARRAAGPPPPPTGKPAAAGPSVAPPPPPPSRIEMARTAPPPPPSSARAASAPTPPPAVRAERPVPPPEAAREPIVPSEGIWDEILGETVEAAPEEMPSPLDAGPSTSELEEFKVPLFDTSRIDEEEVEEEVEVAAVSEDQEGITDEFVVPAFDSGTTTEVAEEEYAVPAFDSSYAAPEPVEEYAVPAFDTSEPVEALEEVEEEEEEYAVPAFDSALEVPAAEPFRPAAAVPVAEPAAAAPTTFDNYIVLEVKGSELRLKRRNISLREAVSLFEVALEECRKLLEE
ncbi:MAG: hypothetical protein NTW26_10535 [bacterium]|nr:hypothetical protein [bacterium]